MHAAGPCLSATFCCPVWGSWLVQVKHQWPYMQQLILFQSFMISSRLIHIPALRVCFLQFSCIRGRDTREALRALGVPPSSLWTGAALFQKTLLPIQNSGSMYSPSLSRFQGTQRLLKLPISAGLVRQVLEVSYTTPAEERDCLALGTATVAGIRPVEGSLLQPCDVFFNFDGPAILALMPST